MENTVENFMIDRVSVVARSEFLKYCSEPPREWGELSVVTVGEFDESLEDFKMARPRYAHYVHSNKLK